MGGTVLGIARKARPRAALETIDAVAVGLAFGIEGDYRGRRAGGRRQVTVMALADWHAAMADLGPNDLVWSDRRVNLLVDGIDLPCRRGAPLRIGGALFAVTGECDPCARMDAIRPGLRAALTPRWRGGRTLRVLGEGRIAIGDTVTMETELAEAV